MNTKIKEDTKIKYRGLLDANPLRPFTKDESIILMNLSLTSDSELEPLM